MSAFATAAVSAVIAAISIGALALLVIWRTPQRPLAFHVVIVTLAGSLTIAASSAIAVQLMVLTPENFSIISISVLIGTLASLAIVASLGAFVQRGSQSLHRMTAAVARGVVPNAPSAPGNREFAELGTALVDAAVELHQERAKVARVERARVEAISWISHDLRTPLASIKAMSESIADGVARDPSAYLHRIGVEADTMAALISDLVEYSALTASGAAGDTRPVDLVDLIDDVVVGLRPLAERRSIAIRVHAEAPIVVTGNPRLFARALQNLVDNAVRYARPGTIIQVEVRARPVSGTIVTVADACGAAAPEDFERAFEPGWRGDVARTAATGSGLGLAIVRAVASAHGGSVKAEALPGGCRFVWEIVGHSAAS